LPASYRQKESEIADSKMTIEFGVQVTRRFADEGDVVCKSTPAGRAATTVLIGPCGYGDLFVGV